MSIESKIVVTPAQLRQAMTNWFLQSQETDFPTYQVLRERGLTSLQAIDAMAGQLIYQIDALED